MIRPRAAPAPRPAGRVRVDELLVARGLAPTRAAALGLVMAGRVRTDGTPVDKAGRLVRRDAPLELGRVSPYVSRGGEKLEAALAAFGVSPAGRVCLDVGASTGGFTDCLLAHGARRVHALDVGRQQLHVRLRDDRRVTVHEGMNARYLQPSWLPDLPSLAVVDVSFISLEKVVPAVAGCLDPGGRREIVALVKPQFEVGRGRVGKGGVVRDAARHREVLLRLLAAWQVPALGTAGLVASPLAGAKGNREFFVHLVVGEAGRSAEDLVAAVERLVGETAERTSRGRGCGVSA